MTCAQRIVPALVLVFALQGAAARGQYYYPYGAGYGGYGFGGWGATPQGSMAAGMGVFAAGAGQYNYNTAQARSINANTAMQWNNYWWTAQNSLNREHYARLKSERKQLNSAADAIENRIRDNPNESDIDHGDAENAILTQLTNPKVLEGSGLARANGQLSAKLVKSIPFRYAPEMAVICIDRLRNDIPELLMSNELKTEREAFAAAVKRGVALIKEGKEVPPQLVEEVRTTGRALYTKVEKGMPDASSVERNKALTYLKNLKVFLRMLKSPDFDQALRDLDKYQTTTVGNLLAFMHTYNLRFGPATTPEQQTTYRQLYPLLRADRDKVMNAVGPVASSPTAPPPPGPGEFFQGIENRHLVEQSKPN